MTSSFKTKFDAELVRVKELLVSPEWISSGPGETVTEIQSTLKRSQLIDEAGLKPMRVLNWRTVLELKRIPRSDEGYAMTIEEAYKLCENTGLSMCVQLLSHRWARAKDRFPDDEQNGKAKAVCRISQYNVDVYQREMFWWIDYSCVDQDDPAYEIAALPLYVGTATNNLCYDHQMCTEKKDDYYYRPWCRIEMLMGYVFNTPRAWFYDPYDKPGEYESDLKAMPMGTGSAGYYKLLNPLEPSVLENITVKEDLPAIEALTNLALEVYPLCRDNFIPAHKEFSPKTIDFKTNSSWYWRMEEFVVYQDQKLDDDGWLPFEPLRKK